VTTYCLSCATNYTKKGWKCQKNVYCGFSITLGNTPDNILAKVDTIITSILGIIGENSTNVQAVTFDSIISGSTLITGSIDPSISSVSAATSLLQASIASGGLSG
jgi:hypothetical protein